MSLIIKYPLDLTGQNPNNRVIDEYHTLPDVEVNRVFCMDYGPFFTRGLVLKDHDTQRVLDINVDYVPLHIIPGPTMKSGLEVCAAIAIINETVGEAVTVTAQYIGGEYSFLTDVIIRLLDDLELDNRPVEYGDLIGLPSEFLPSGHLHDLGDLYGFEYMVDALYQVRDAILVGNQHYLDTLETRINNAISQFRDDSEAQWNIFQNHMNNQDNPHETDQIKVGLNLLMNYPVATPQEIDEGNRPDRYLTVEPLMQWIFTNLRTPMTDHINATGNAHNMVPADIGLGNTPNFSAASLADMLSPVLPGNRLVTPDGLGALLALFGLGARIQLTSAHNLDSLDRPGKYFYHNSSKPVNALPNTGNDGVVFIELEAITTGQGVLSAKVQTGIDLQSGARYFRRTTNVSGSWVYNDWDPQ